MNLYRRKAITQTPNKYSKTFDRELSLEDPLTTTAFKKLNKRISHLEQKVLQQEMFYRSFDADRLTSSDDECDEASMRSVSNGLGRPGCSYIQNYSHVPGTSAFQRLAQQAHGSTQSGSHAITLEKEHNSEQYGRHFTTYDGITARGRRQSASVPGKREEYSRGTSDRVHRIRHKLPPVRDYRLMDTLHYLAQGEFAPRDDGIKLTPSREAVLSDIIWEDVCRTHWPTIRMARLRQERSNARGGELQRLIDQLLRERVQHVERRRRRHYRIVKLNHRNESCRAIGKTGDIIVASHKSKDANLEIPTSDHEASALMAQRQWDEQTPRCGYRSTDRMETPEPRQKHRSKPEDCTPGPSCAKEPTCCYRASNTRRLPSRSLMQGPRQVDAHNVADDLVSESSTSSKPLKPRLIVNNVGSGSIRRKVAKEDPNLAQYIVLPTLVIRTPSNVKRQKKFNELYQRILAKQCKNKTDGSGEDSKTKKRDEENHKRQA